MLEGVNRKANTIAWAILACLLWSTAYSSIKIGLQYDRPFHFAGIRFLLAGLLILPFTVRPREYIRSVVQNWKTVFWVTMLQTVINYSLFYQGLDLVPGAIGAVIVGSQPLVTSVVAAILHDNDKLTKRKIVMVLAGLTGVIFISIGRQALKLGDLKELIGIVMILGANISVASSNVLVSVRSKGMKPLVLSSSTLFLGGLILYIFSIPVEGLSAFDFPSEYWLVLAWLSFMGAAAFSIWFHLLQRPGVKVSELNLWKFIIPVVGAVLSWLLVPDEKPEWITVTGMIIITASLIIFFTGKDGSGKSREKGPSL